MRGGRGARTNFRRSLHSDNAFKFRFAMPSVKDKLIETSQLWLLYILVFV